MRIITFGDSVTVGTREGVATEETYSALLQKSLCKNGVEVEVLSKGRRGETTAMALHRLPEVLALGPDYLTVMYGLNDAAVDAGKQSPRVALAEYSRNLETIVNSARTAGVTPLLLTPNPMGSFGITHELYGSREPYLSNGINFLVEEYAAAARIVGETMNVPVLNVYREFFHCAESGNIAPFLTDGMHPNPTGHAIISQMLARHFASIEG